MNANFPHLARLTSDRPNPPATLSPMPTQTIYEGRIVRLEVEDGKWEYVRHADAVAVLALREGKMLCVRQTRRTIGVQTVEAPAGLIDPGETPAEAARRELREEAGLDGDMTLLTRFYTSPGYCDEEIYLYRADNLFDGSGEQDEDEDIEVLWLDPRELLSDLREGRLVGSASTVTAALYALAELG